MVGRTARTRILAYVGILGGAAAAWLLLGAGPASADGVVSPAPSVTSLLPTEGDGQGPGRPAGRAADAVSGATRAAVDLTTDTADEVADRTPVGGGAVDPLVSTVEHDLDHTASAVAGATEQVAVAVDDVAATLVDVPAEAPDREPVPGEVEAPDPSAPAAGDSPGSAGERDRGPGRSDDALPQPAIDPAAAPPTPVATGTSIPEGLVGPGGIVPGEAAVIGPGAHDGCHTCHAPAAVSSGDGPTLLALPAQEPTVLPMPRQPRPAPPGRPQSSPATSPDVSPD